MFYRFKKEYAYLTIPMILIMGMVIAWPLIQTFMMSFTDADLLGIKGSTFTGLKNFVGAFSNRGFVNALKVSGTFAVVVVSAEVLLGTAAALLVNEPLKGSRIVRVFLILPWAVPTIVNAIMWRLIYNPEYGALNSLLYQLGIISKYESWLGNGNIALWAIMFADVWKNFSLVSLIVVSSLQSLPDVQIEAAKIDGANAPQRFFFITMPHIIPAIQIALVLRIIEAVKVFDIIYVMTKGGPANKTRSGSIFVYQEAFTNSRIGAGSAYAIIMVAFIMILILAYMKILSRQKR